MGAPARTLEMSEQLDQGLAIAMRRPALFIGLFDLLWTLDTLFPKAEAELKDLIGLGLIAEACAILVRPRSFRRRTTWTLFWSLTEASTRFADRGRTASREPELNGTLMTLVASAIEAFPASQGAHVAMVVGDHATLGNEARSGADFGLILEVEHGSTVRHLTVLLQAKRAPQRRVDVRRAAGTSTQLDRLVNSGVGSYVFYHAHEDPAGLGPTLRDAGAISGSNPASIDVLSPASDFAARIAAAADQLFVTSPTYALPGFGVPDGRDAALRMLFNPARPGMRVNDVVIARVGDDGLSPREIAAFRSEWSRLVERHRRAVEGVGSTRRSAQDREPPLTQS